MASVHNCLAPFSCGGHHDALRALAQDSYLRKDLFSPSFFWQYWDILKEGLAFQELMDTLALPANLLKGFIFLVRKYEGGSKEIQ